MKTLTLAVAAAMTLAFTLPAASAVEDPLFEANRNAIIARLGEDYDPDAVDTSDPLDLTPRTMEEAVDETARMLTEQGLDLETLLGTHEAGGPGSSFPIVSSLAGLGVILEIGIWFGALPIRCDAVNLHHLADLPAGPRDLLYTPLSTKTQINLALGTDALGQLPQTVVYTGKEVFALGTIGNGCVQFELCVFGICLLSFLVHAAVLLTGVITDDVTGTGALPLAYHAAEPLL